MYSPPRLKPPGQEPSRKNRTPDDIDPPVSYDQDIQQDLITIGSQPNPVAFKDPTAFRGGTLTFTAMASVNGTFMTGTLNDVQIQGENPLRMAVQSYIDR